MFQNLGDGTYIHSGSLGIRQVVASDVNMTFKILYNDAVAMTGGEVTLRGARGDLLDSLFPVMEQAGAKMTRSNDGITVSRNGAGLKPVDVDTAPYPGFPTATAGRFH